MPNGGIDEGRV